MSPIREEPKASIFSVVKKVALPIFLGFIAFLFGGGAVYFMTVDDGSYREEDKTSTPFAVEQFTDNIVIFEDGTIETSMTAEELWNQMIEDDSRVFEYLDEPAELKKLINAQVLTNNLDTRPVEDIKEYDKLNQKEKKKMWEEINKDITSRDVQGIIKLTRNSKDNYLEYTDPDTFQHHINEYNKSGSEESKNFAMTHYTIEKGYVSSSGGGNYKTGTDGEAKKIEAGDVIEIPQGYGYGTTYTYNSWQLIGAGKQLELRQRAGMTFDEEGFGRINGRYCVAVTPKFGNVGDYIDYYYQDTSGKEQMIPCIICDVKGSDAKNEWGHHGGTNVLEFYVNEETWCTPNWGHGHSWYKSCGKADRMHANPATEGFHMEWAGHALRIVNGGSYFENPDFVNEKIEEKEDPTKEKEKEEPAKEEDKEKEDPTKEEPTEHAPLKWPTDPGASITSYFGPRTAPTAGASSYHQGIDIGVAYKEVYATESGKVVNSEEKALNGKWIKLDHGNGYESVYLHNSELLVSVGQEVAKGQVIAISGNTGVGTGPHLHFGIKYNGNYINPLLFKYDNGKGNGTGGFGSAIDVDESATGINSGAASYYAKVATWNEVTEKVESTDPEQATKNETKYNMTTTKINYQQLVSGYKMPFDYLWALLVISEDKEFVSKIADLVYDSKIVITVYDNVMTNTTVSTDTYTKATKVITDNVIVDVKYDENQKYEYGGPFQAEKTQPYSTTTTVITTTNTLNVALTEADVWIVKYTQDFKGPKTTNTPSTPSEKKFDDEEYPEEPNHIDNADAMGLAEIFRQNIQNKYEKSYEDVETDVIEADLISKYYYKTINRVVKTSNTTIETKYIAEPAVIEEKTDKKSKKDNFVTIFVDYRRARHTTLRSNKMVI